MVHSCAAKTPLAILADLGDRLFSILVDEARDCSVKEQMVVLIRYVNTHGQVMEWFLGLVHVRETLAKCLKEIIDSLFTNYHHYRVEIFLEVVDSIQQEMNHRFSEASTKLLDCFAYLDPKNGFSNFNVEKFAHLTHLYPNGFSRMDCSFMPQELESFLSDMRRDKRFSDVDDLGSLAKKMKETAKDRLFPLVYYLVELVLLLPVATASVEMIFSDMTYVKTNLRNRMGDMNG